MDIKLKDLRQWINQVPTEFDEFPILIAEIIGATEESFTYQYTRPILTITIEEESKQVLMLGPQIQIVDENDSREHTDA
jgi:hypothetical protein